MRLVYRYMVILCLFFIVPDTLSCLLYTSDAADE